MTDRELLEAAAKAAGIKVGWRKTANCFCYSDSPYEVAWNPLADDGDALRLAVRRRFHICVFSAKDGEIPTPGFVEVWQEGDADPLHVEYVDGSNYEAATRRAIVRAAAASLGERGKTP